MYSLLAAAAATALCGVAVTGPIADHAAAAWISQADSLVVASTLGQHNPWEAAAVTTSDDTDGDGSHTEMDELLVRIGNGEATFTTIAVAPRTYEVRRGIGVACWQPPVQFTRPSVLAAGACPTVQDVK